MALFQGSALLEDYNEGHINSRLITRIVDDPLFTAEEKLVDICKILGIEKSTNPNQMVLNLHEDPFEIEGHTTLYADIAGILKQNYK